MSNKNLSIQQFHNLHFPDKHRNTTYQKIKKIEDQLLSENLIKLKKCKTYNKIIVINDIEVKERIKKVSLF